MDLNPDALLAQAVLRRGLITLQELQGILRATPPVSDAPGAIVTGTLIDALASRGIAPKAELERMLEEERKSVGEDPLPPEVLSALMKPEGRLGRYVRVRILGHGGTATVWQAWDLETRRMVALKMLAAPGVTPTRYALREAKIAAELAHHNIVPVYEVRQDRDAFGRDVHYMAMAWVDGSTLDGAFFPVEESLRIVRDAARAVHYAHERGIIHRDVKPGNILVDGNGHVFVMDFGLAKPVEGVLETATRDGIVVGTPAFMSPEQALGLNQELTPQSDVYGLGATLYALVTGRAPFEAESAVELCIKVVREPLAPPRQIVPGIAPDVERIVLRAMHKDRSRRYRTAQALAEDIEKFLAGMPIMDEEELAFTQALGVLREGKLEEAIQLFREAQREGGLEASRRRVARLAEEAGSPAERGAYRLAEAIVRTLEKGSPAEPCGAARAAFAEALKADAGQAEARLGDGLALVLLARVSGEVAKAQALLEEAAGAFTVCAGTPAVRAAAMHNRGIAKFYQARWAEGDRKKALLAGAIADFGIAVGADPGFAYALKDLGVAKLALAQADPSKPLQAAPISESVQHFTRALEIKADLEGALYERGRAYYALGRFAEAVDDWKKCVAIAPLRAKQVAPLVRDAEHALKARKP